MVVAADGFQILLANLHSDPTLYYTGAQSPGGSGDVGTLGGNSNPVASSKTLSQYDDAIKTYKIMWKTIYKSEESSTRLRDSAL